MLTGFLTNCHKHSSKAFLAALLCKYNVNWISHKLSQTPLRTSWQHYYVNIMLTGFLTNCHKHSSKDFLAALLCKYNVNWISHKLSQTQF